MEICEYVKASKAGWKVENDEKFIIEGLPGVDTHKLFELYGQW